MCVCNMCACISSLHSIHPHNLSFFLLPPLSPRTPMRSSLRSPVCCARVASLSYASMTAILQVGYMKTSGDTWREAHIYRHTSIVLVTYTPPVELDDAIHRDMILLDGNDTRVDSLVYFQLKLRCGATITYHPYTLAPPLPPLSVPHVSRKKQFIGRPRHFHRRYARALRARPLGPAGVALLL